MSRRRYRWSLFLLCLAWGMTAQAVTLTDDSGQRLTLEFDPGTHDLLQDAAIQHGVEPGLHVLGAEQRRNVDVANPGGIERVAGRGRGVGHRPHVGVQAAQRCGHDRREDAPL